jgi:hypothetical protein
MLLTQVCMLGLSPISHETVLTIYPSFVKILVIEIFSSVLGLFGLIIGLLMTQKAPEMIT